MASADTALHDLFGAVDGGDITTLQMAARGVVACRDHHCPFRQSILTKDH